MSSKAYIEAHKYMDDKQVMDVYTLWESGVNHAGHTWVTFGDAEDCIAGVLHKQIPMKVGKRHLRQHEMGSEYYCPRCEADIIRVEFLHFGDGGDEVSWCWHCGGALDWSVVDDD